MKKIVILAVLVCSFLFGDDWDDDYWKERSFMNKKNLGFALCVKTFYKDLPSEIADADRAFNSIEFIDPDDPERILKFIHANIDRYIPNFKHPESYPKKWYFVACLNMYNSEEYEDMIRRKGKYAK